MKLTAAAGAMIVAVALAGCSLATPVVKRADVETKISTSLEEKVGKRPDSVACPGDLNGKVGQKMTCHLTSGGQSLPVDVTVASVDGSNVKFDIQVGSD